MNSKNAEFYVYDGLDTEAALKRTTHLAISAHQDDIEFMAYSGIEECFGKKDKWFSAVVVTNGAGSPRNGLYADYTDEEMQVVRRLEQKKAAFVGEYGALALLNYSSAEVKNAANDAVIHDLAEIIEKCAPTCVYTHNPADKHDTHVATLCRVIAAIRLLPKEKRPLKVYGCEVWRGLDWVCDNEKIRFDVSGHQNIATAVMGVFDSQISGGKRYDSATIGRRLANATYAEDHAVDNSSQLSYAIDLSPLLANDKLSVEDYILRYIDGFAAEVKARLNRIS